MAHRNPCGITGLMKLPQRLYAGMNAFPAVQHFTTDTCVLDVTLIRNDCARDSDRPLGVVSRLRDSPVAIPLRQPATRSTTVNVGWDNMCSSSRRRRLRKRATRTVGALPTAKFQTASRLRETSQVEPPHR